MTLRAVGTFDSGTTSCIPVLPAGTVANDILVMFIETLDSETPTVSGWTQAPNSPQSNATDATKLSVYYKRAAGGDATTTGGTTDHVSAVILGFSGIQITGSPWDVTAGSVDTTSNGSISIPGATTTRDNCDIIVALGMTRDAANTANFSGWTNSDLTGLTEQYDRTIATGTGGGIGIATATLPTHGAYGATTASMTSSQRKCMWTGALRPEVAPITVDLAPADTANVSSLIPSFDWLGVDVNVDDIEYEIVIQNLIDSYSEANQDSVLNFTSALTGVGQTFHGVSKPLKVCKFFMRKAAAPTGTMAAKLYAVTGTFGTNAAPTGGALATSDTINVSTLTTTLALVTFTFSTPFTMSSGTDYAVVVEYAGSDATNLIAVGYDLVGSTHAGNMARLSSGSWASASGDLCFYTYDTLIDKVSSADTGFQNVSTPADTHPFGSSFDTIRYTIQSADALRNGDTYTWSVRGIDPNGGNTYGSFSTARTFTIVVLSPPNRPQWQAVTRAATR